MGLLARTLATMLLVTPVALAAAPVAPPAVVERVTLRAGATPAVELGLSRATTPTVHRLASPPRVYIDLPDAAVAPTVARSLDGVGPVKTVRLGQFDPRTVRLVVELGAPTPFAVEPDGTTLRLVFGRDGAPAAKAQPAPTAPAPAAKSPAPAAKADAIAEPAAPAAKIVPIAKAAAAPARRAAPSAAEPAPATPPDALPPDVPRLTVVRTDAPVARRTPSAFPTALEERIARRDAAGDGPGIVALYAADPTAIRRNADSVTRAAVVDALRELGLVRSARKLLGPASPGEAPALRIARAELALDARQVDAAAGLVSGLDEAGVDPVLAPRLRRVRVRLALARGDVDGAVTLGAHAASDLRGEIAEAAIRAGRAAADRRGCRRAITVFRQALDADPSRTARAAAGAGLVRAALACDDRDATMSGLGVLAESPHPLLRRAAAAIATAEREERHTGGAGG